MSKMDSRAARREAGQGTGNHGNRMSYPEKKAMVSHRAFGEAAFGDLRVDDTPRSLTTSMKANHSRYQIRPRKSIPLLTFHQEEPPCGGT